MYSHIGRSRLAAQNTFIKTHVKYTCNSNIYIKAEIHTWKILNLDILM